MNAIEVRGGHYLATVAGTLLAQRLPVNDIDVLPPERVNGDYRKAVGLISFTRDFAHEVAGHECNLTLDWWEDSGWCLTRVDLDDTAEERWLGAGLVPAPDRVAAFVAGAQLDLATAGSGERPYYRQAPGDLGPLLERLGGYADAQHNQGFGADWSGRFVQMRTSVYEVRAIGVLTGGQDDPVIDVPMHASELAAVLDLLEYLQPHFPADSVSGLSIAGALRQDLLGRTPGEQASTVARRARDVAHTRRRQLDTGFGDSSESGDDHADEDAR